MHVLGLLEMRRDGYMTTIGFPPAPDLSRLAPLAPRDVAFTFVASQRGGRAEKAHAIEVLSRLLTAETAEGAFADATANNLVQEKGGVLSTIQTARTNGGGAVAHPKHGWPPARQALALRALSIEMPVSGTKSRRRPDLAAVALRQLYGPDELPPLPSRLEFRSAFLTRAMSGLGAPLEILRKQPLKPFKFDTLSRRIYLALAGLESGSAADADGALLRPAFGVASVASPELAAAIIRSAVKLAQTTGPAKAVLEEVSDLERFARSIKKLARGIETGPYRGRVAIAEVYDAGVAAGLSLGSLDDFKRRLAEAAREGLLDLERYDIAGPFDATLKERSRLRLGRDERHFIVNQWV